MKKLLVAALMVVLASPAFAAIQNVKVSGDITTSYVDRNNFDLGLQDYTPVYSGEGTSISSYTNGLPTGLKKQSVFLTQTRLRVDADLSDNVSTTVGLINERAWNGENASNPSGSTANYANDTNVQLYLASVTLREFLYSPLSVTVGRQVFTYGNGFIIGNGLPNQATGNLQYIDQDLTERTSEDGVRAVLDYKPLTIDLIYFKNSQTAASIAGAYVSNPQQSSDVYGYNANYQLSDPFNTVVEQYMFARINGSGSQATGGVDDFNGPANDGVSGEGKGDTLFVPGLRASTNPVKGLNVQGEIAWQLGDQAVANYNVSGNPTSVEAEHRDAMGAQFMASYALPVLDKYKPTLNASYTYVSGDKNGGANGSTNNSILQTGTKSAKVFTAWDPMFEGQGAGTIYNTLYTLSNMNILSLGASAAPLEDVTTTFTWTNLWAADSYGAYNPLALYQPDGGANLYYPETKKDAKGLGNEYDVNVTYNYTEDVTFGVSLGWYVPGSVFGSTVSFAGAGGPNKDIASQAIANLAVKF